MRLLLVEDNARFAGLLRQGLAGEGFDAEWVADGRSGLLRAAEGGFDVIVLDVMLPGMNGYEMCARLRAMGDTTPVLMLTAKDGEYDIAEGLETGADDYLVKPFSFVVLVARLRALARRGGRQVPSAWLVGDLRVDPAAMRVWRGEEEVNLTAKEFAVLACLAERAEQVIAKPEIVERVWDAQADRALNVVEVYISALRRKIDTPFGRASILTVRGAGYRLTAGGPSRNHHVRHRRAPLKSVPRGGPRPATPSRSTP
ncbi:response regulator transcription factor [Streptomyces melanogenes]|uniref:response regulator transcription factor n=1 Tax=Streptomyces melanogenes TaxID=67326 RepID=UPI0037B73EFA